jgi:putative ATP-dependent endonuclease of OLD family
VISGASENLNITEANEKHLTMHFPELKEAFFSHCVVLIEGATEYGCIRRFAETLKIPLDDLGICIIKADGEGNIEPLRQLLAVFRIPSIAIYDRDVKEKKGKSDRDFFTSEIFFEAEIVRKLYDANQQQLAREIAVELEGSALFQTVDENWYNKYISKAGISGEGYVPKKLGEVSLEDEDEFCNVYSAWFTAKKGILLGRIVGEKFTAELIPDCYRDALLKAQEVAANAG